jgi:ATP-dependent DNA ligase
MNTTFYTYESKTSRDSNGDPIRYTTIVNGAATSCDCDGWVKHRARNCWHVRDAAAGGAKAIAISTTRPAPRSAPAKVSRRAFTKAAAAVVTAPVVATPPPAPRPAVAPKPATDTGFIHPQLAAPMPDVATFAQYETAAYVMEQKLDGHRLVVTVADGTVTAWSRLDNKRDLPPHLTAALAALPNGTYDGELLVPGGKSHDVVRAENAHLLVYAVFDLTRLLGFDVTGQPLSTRRAYLSEIFADDRGPVYLVAQSPVSRADIDARIARGEEGVIIKALASTYRPGYRSPDWIKVKALGSMAVTLTGWEAGKSGPYSKIAYVTPTGYRSTVKTRTTAMLADFARTPTAYIGREFRIEYQEILANGSIRHARFDRWENE